MPAPALSSVRRGKGSKIEPIRPTRFAPDDLPAMPSLIRLLVILAILGGIGYGAMWALANLVQPQPREMSVSVPLDRKTP